MYREGFPVIETPLAFDRTIQEMLMTSYGNTIRIFPGIPSVWKNVAFADMRSEGAFLVTASRENGITRFVKIKSLAGEPCRVVPADLKKTPPPRQKTTARNGSALASRLCKEEIGGKCP